MLLRLLLVGAVTTLGLDLPTEGGPQGVHARDGCQIVRPADPAELAGPIEVACDEPAPTPAPSPESIAAPMPDGPDAFACQADPAAPAPITGEQIHRALDVVNAWFGRLPAAPLPSPEPVPAPDPDAGFQIALRATLDGFAAERLDDPPAPILSAVKNAPAPARIASLADALNAESDGLPDGSWFVPEGPDFGPLAVFEPFPPPIPEREEVRTTRVADAVRLTGQAFQAWLSVLQTPALALDTDPATLSR